MNPPVIDKFGTQQWRDANNRLHREDGPALIYADGSTEWYYDGLRHCLTGPACFYSYGYKAFWIFGKQVTESEFNFFFKKHESGN